MQKLKILKIVCEILQLLIDVQSLNSNIPKVLKPSFYVHQMNPTEHSSKKYCQMLMIWLLQVLILVHKQDLPVQKIHSKQLCIKTQIFQKKRFRQENWPCKIKPTMINQLIMLILKMINLEHLVPFGLIILLFLNPLSPIMINVVSCSRPTMQIIICVLIKNHTVCWML